MRASSQKELSVYEFGAGDLSVEPLSSKYAKWSLSSSLDPKEEEHLTKYQFLQAYLTDQISHSCSLVH
ncbi:kinesin-like protein KIN-7D, chloroplastic isoform X2 [Iris pallida]|uniref:Kinesin-like protein KIN-7D, chloroplastic isoform X2 n=1 Tax=Iris pallida TaxID=29817 RepID=A0AAX6HSE6_IRIPA|nr:kinesin-like protein KIN-7D, chloroplastic isoform X2 [Iris pallida]KAJ6843782.1 kinesin-like protein KIN-7D, chloroplastic isoform X2 [Iris pallida]